MPTTDRIAGLIDALDCSPWGASCGRTRRAHGSSRPLYTNEERRRRDASPWTVVQGVLAPLQFAVFLVSLALVTRYLLTGAGYEIATWSVVIKTLVLYAIMVTGCIWEKEVFGRWLFAPAFFWEDVFSMLVLALHTAYLGVVIAGIGDGRAQMLLALAAYAAYVFNAAQFLLKLRAARREDGRWQGGSHAAPGAAG
ncbi:2-vinyl bacteriochlorophyllide hydratase [Roseomonas alkaliterrae]|uniref:3-vinyl bacteriochlorophyllide hydratase n=1 Tax=Neoroseomonas alkaliterrae TaxID=1452450 RepID=A0A840Y5I5_9PROT|nr:2-vinyl bacteriochlorophyllide hydratase [Neoroseomonas alkaliterrae]MBB5689882.1 3-vinyl bacteriochlorophyllide hydratase [Neoroseomonas alkaliterrae]MBR0675047.1 2-vinyl bacteriochlorophyllide hydratase [Neoroseomonas alkaliterrae]